MPQIENGYVRIASELLDAIILYRIPGEQMKVFLFIIRKTYGFRKKSDHIALSQFVIATGMKKPTVCRALKGLKDKNLIVIKKDNKIALNYSINKYYKQWKLLSKKITLSKKIISVDKKDNLSLSKKSTTIDTLTKDTITKERKEYIRKNWNALSEKLALPKIKSITESRSVKLRLRIKEGFSIDEIINAIDKQPFLSGKNNRKWKISFDWLISNDTNWIKVIELKYIQDENSSDDNIMSEAGRQTYQNGLNAIKRLEEEDREQSKNDN